MATCSPQTLLTDAACFNGLMNLQLQIIKARLLCQILQALDPMATCDPETLLSEAGCLNALTPFQLQVVQTQLMCNISSNPAFSGGVIYGGNGDPNGVQTGSPPDIFVQYDADGQQWSKTSGVGTNTGWV